MNPMQMMMQGMIGGMGGQNNPMAQMMGMMQGAKNPQQMLNMMLQQNPQAKQMMQTLQGKSPAQLRTMAENIAKERGTTLEAMAQQMGIPMK